MILAGNLKRGIIIKIDNNLFEVMNVTFVKPGKGGAFARTKIRNLKTRAITDKMFRTDEKVSRASISTVSIEYIYKHADFYHFMDFDTNEEYILGEEQLGDKVHYLIENQKVTAKIHQGSVIDIELSASVILTVSQTEPGLKGNTVSGATKKAVLGTGFNLQVPLFINPGDKIKVDTRTGKYINRA